MNETRTTATARFGDHYLRTEFEVGSERRREAERAAEQDERDAIRTTLIETVARDTEIPVDHGDLVVAAEYRHGVDHTLVEDVIDEMEAEGRLRSVTDDLGTPRWRLP